MSVKNPQHYLPSGGGEMGGLVRAKDWSKTTVGSPQTWPQSLRTALSIVLNSKFPMFLWWGPELICFYNDAYRPSLGQYGKHPSILGMPAEEAWPEIWQIIKPMITEVLAGGEATWSEDQLIPIYRNGKIEDVYWTFSYSPVNDESNAVAAVLVTCTETTEKIITLRKVEASEERFRMMADNIPNLAWMAHADGGIYWYNKKWYEYTGTVPEQMQGWGWQSVHDPKELPIVLERWKASIAGGYPFEMVFPLKGADGKFRPFLTRVLPVKNAEGIIQQWFGSNTDIAGQKEAEAALKESEERFRTMAENTEILIAVSDETSNANYFNKAWADLTGRPVEDLLNFGWVDLVHPDDRPGFVEIYLSAFDKKQPWSGEFRILEKKRSYRWLLAKGHPRFRIDGSFAGYISSCIDITELKVADEILRESEKRFRSLTESIPQLVWETDEKGNALFASARWKELTGIIPEGETTWKAVLHPDDYEHNKNTWLHSLATGEIYRCDVRIRNKEGEYRWHSVIGEPVFDKEHKIIKWVGAFTDIHSEKAFTHELETQVESRTNELEKANKKLAQKNDELEKMNKELQSFAYISSHDLQEPLRKIQTFSSQIIQTESENLSVAGKDKFRRMEKAAKRMQTLIEDLLTYSRTNTAERKFEHANLQLIIEEIIEDLKEELQQKHATIEATQMCGARIIPFQFRQLMYNLIINSLKFSNGNHAPHIKIKSKIDTGINLSNEKLLKEKKYCHISVSDNGIGFEQQYSERIFEVFQRLHGKSQYSGTGIGLAIVKKIVENHNGIITAMSEPDKGATFDIYIPAE